MIRVQLLGFVLESSNFKIEAIIRNIVNNRMEKNIIIIIILHLFTRCAQLTQTKPLKFESATSCLPS